MGLYNSGLMTYQIRREELVDHLEKRAKHHEDRARWWAAEAEKADKELIARLESAGTVTDRLDIKASSEYSNTTRIRESAREKMQGHQLKAKEFAWKVAHLGPGPVMDVNEEDLKELEFIT